MGFSSGYKLFYVLHLTSVVVAFAPIVVALVPGGRGTTASVSSATGRVVYSTALVAAGLFGVLCVVTSDSVWEFSQTWISLAFIVWIVMNGVLHGMVLAGLRRARAASVERGEQLLALLFAVMLYLMVWKPGA